jgi:hypothetical protein
MNKQNKDTGKTHEMKEGYYMVADGLGKFEMELDNPKFKKASDIIKKMEKLHVELYNELGGI